MVDRLTLLSGQLNLDTSTPQKALPSSDRKPSDSSAGRLSGLLNKLNLDSTARQADSSYFWNNEEIVKQYVERGNIVQTKRYFQALNWLDAHPIKCTETVVDIGAGDGNISALFAMKVLKGNLLAVDYSIPMVRAAQINKRNLKLANMNVWHADATNLSLPTENESIDRIISFTAIHWFNDINKFMAGVDKYLKPGGVFFFRYAGCEGDQTLELAEEMRKEEEWASKFEGFENPMHTYPVDEMRGSIKKVHMVCEKAAIWENVERFRDREGYKNYVAGWLPHLYHLSGDDREKFLEELISRHCSNEDNYDHGDLIVRDTQVEVWGFKPAATKKAAL